MEKLEKSFSNLTLEFQAHKRETIENIASAEGKFNSTLQS